VRTSHALLCRLLFLVAIERRFNIGWPITREVLWTYAEEFTLVEMIKERLSEIDKESAQVQARFEAAVFAA
jgi:hypothetical protein